MSEVAVLQLDQVTKRFGDTVVLDRMDLTVQPGECVGLLGPNGAGKTTLLRLATGGLVPTSGRLECLGTEPHRADNRFRHRCSYLPAEAGVDPARTGQQTLDLWLSPYGDRRSPVFDSLREAFPLPLESRVGTWSAGMKQKLLLLLTLGVDAQLFLLDEPERALDPTARWHLRNALRTLHSQERTLVVSTHDLGTVESFAQRTVFLSRGQRIPGARIDAIRAELQRELRLSLRPETELPPGAEIVERRPDGWIILRTEEPALRWLPCLDPAHVLGVEFGASDLAAIYRHVEGLVPTRSEATNGADR